MILQDSELRKWAKDDLGVRPYNDLLLNPASIDLTLGNGIREPMWYWRPGLWRLAIHLHRKDPNKWPLWGQEQTFEEYVLKPGGFVLCASAEYTTLPKNKIGILFSKSSTGRIGLEHLHAGFGDAAFEGQWTWELVNVAPWPIILKAGKPLMQLVLANLVGVPEKGYDKTGRYQRQMGPTPSRRDDH